MRKRDLLREVCSVGDHQTRPKHSAAFTLVRKQGQIAGRGVARRRGVWRDLTVMICAWSHYGGLQAPLWTRPASTVVNMSLAIVRQATTPSHYELEEIHVWVAERPYYLFLIHGTEHKRFSQWAPQTRSWYSNKAYSASQNSKVLLQMIHTGQE